MALIKGSTMKARIMPAVRMPIPSGGPWNKGRKLKVWQGRGGGHGDESGDQGAEDTAGGPEGLGHRVPVFGEQKSQAELFEGREGRADQVHPDGEHHQGDEHGAGKGEPAEGGITPGRDAGLTAGPGG